MPNFWCCLLLCNISIGFCVASVAQQTCEGVRGRAGVCTSFADCSSLKNNVLYQDDFCEDGTICCPNVHKPATKMPVPAPTTAPPKKIPSFDAEFYRRLTLTFGDKYNIFYKNNTTTTSTEMPLTTESALKFEEKLHPLGVQILSSLKCGYVYASKNPDSSNIEADMLEFPWMALLLYNNTSNDGGDQERYACSGSLIAERWVLTAAHCIKPNLVDVRLGEFEISNKSHMDCTRSKVVRTCTKYKDFKITTTIKHQEYDEKTGVKDIALIKLKTPVIRSKNIKPICLPIHKKYFTVPYDQKILKIAGWSLSEKDSSSNIMKKSIISVHPPAVCTLNRSKLCLDDEDDLPSTCIGDPGGPIVWLVNDDDRKFYTQIGILPSGLNQCGGEESSLYIGESVADSMDWITKVIGENN